MAFFFLGFKNKRLKHFNFFVFKYKFYKLYYEVKVYFFCKTLLWTPSNFFWFWLEYQLVQF